MMLNKNDIVRIEITDISDKGDGLGKYEGFPLFVRHALPGDVINAKVVKTKKTYGYAVTDSLVSPSPDRVSAPCKVCRACGGCQLQELSYEKQLRIKLDRVNSSLKRIGRFENVTAKEIIPSPEILRYRNKAQLPVGYDKNGRLTAGFYARHSHDIISCDDCVLMPEKFTKIRNSVLEWMQKYHIKPYDEEKAQGCVRHIFIREGRKTGEICVCLIVNADDIPHKKELIDLLQGTEGVCSVCVSVNRTHGNTIMGSEIKSIFGSGFIEEMIGEKKYRISPQSFFQVNPLQTKQLYDYVKTLAEDSGCPEVWDIFCGIGTISIYVSDSFENITGVEAVEKAVEDARVNAGLNNIKKARFYSGPAEDILSGISFDRNTDRVLILDPPRKGCDVHTLDAVEQLSPARLIYVSCDPATLARDLKTLSQKGFKIESVKAFDMFPMTVHCETVCLLSNRKPDARVKIDVDLEDYYRIKDEQKKNKASE